MAKYNGPKDRLSRREGQDLFGKGAKLTRLNVFPGVHGPKGSRGSSQYATQLREKQKVKRMYGVLEKQFRTYVDQAFKSKLNTGVALLVLLERRLDNVVYRLGFTPTRSSARQITSHGHVFVNGKRLNIPSYQTNEGDVITLDNKGQNIPEVVKALNNAEHKLPSWLQKKAIVGKVVASPTREDIVEAISEQDIVEFYSR